MKKEHKGAKNGQRIKEEKIEQKRGREEERKRGREKERKSSREMKGERKTKRDRNLMPTETQRQRKRERE